MKQCKSCGTHNLDNSRFCSACGQNLPSRHIGKQVVTILSGVLMLAVSGLLLVTWLQLRQARNGLTASDQQAAEVSRRFQLSIDSLRRECMRLEEQKCSADHRLTDFQMMVGSVYPMIIDSVQIGNVTRTQDIITQFGSPIRSEDTEFLQPRIYYRGIMHGTVTFYLKWRDSDGHLRVNENSPEGFSQRVEGYVYEESKSINLPGWGSDKPGNWRRGDWQLEVWCNGILLATKHFTLY